MYLAPQPQIISALSSPSLPTGMSNKQLHHTTPHQPASQPNLQFHTFSWKVTCVSFTSQRANDSTFIAQHSQRSDEKAIAAREESRKKIIKKWFEFEKLNDRKRFYSEDWERGRERGKDKKFIMKSFRLLHIALFSSSSCISTQWKPNNNNNRIANEIPIHKTVPNGLLLITIFNTVRLIDYSKNDLWLHVMID